MEINSHNDWGKLRSIIVGRADHARVPTADVSTMSFSYADCDAEQIKSLEGEYPRWVIDEANEDADGLAQLLEEMGVTVYRPSVMDHSKTYSNPLWETTGWYSWCPRDLLLVLGDTIIETPTPMRSRQYETWIYRDILYEAFRDGAEWLAAPTPALPDDSYTFEDLSKATLRNLEIVFDAPNIVKVGRDLLYQVSNSGNMLGYQWLKRVLEPRGYRLHYSELYSFAHFDSTIIPLRPGLVLLNSSRVGPHNCPDLFAKWDKIYFDDCVDQGSKLEGFPSPCSPYIGMNILSVDEDTVIVDDAQEPLMRALDQHGITSVPIRFRHARTLSGGLHCATLDLYRDGDLEDYR